MTRWLSRSVAIMVLAAVSISLSFTHQKFNANPAGVVTGKDIASTKLGPGIWHIEDAYRDSMYVVEGTEKAALIDYEPGKPNKNEYTLSEAAPGVIRIRDYSGYNFAYLVKGETKVALIDTTMGEGNLRAVVEKHTGGLPVELIITHGHIDHAFSANQFKTVSMNRRDDSSLPKQVNPSSFKEIRSDDLFDLGGVTLKAYALPGHTPGSMVLVCPEKRLLFTGDAVGTQSNKGGLWLQLPGCLYVDEYQVVLKEFIARTTGQFDSIFTGHNAGPVGPKYLDYMVLAAQKVIDQGDAALVPSIRPAGIKMVFYGEDNDPFAASINVNPGHVLSGNKK